MSSTWAGRASVKLRRHPKDGSYKSFIATPSRWESTLLSYACMNTCLFVYMAQCLDLLCWDLPRCIVAQFRGPNDCMWGLRCHRSGEYYQGFCLQHKASHSSYCKYAQYSARVLYPAGFPSPLIRATACHRILGVQQRGATLVATRRC